MKTLIRSGIFMVSLLLPSAIVADLGSTLDNTPVPNSQNLIDEIVTTHCPIDGVYSLAQLITIATNEGRVDIANAAIGLIFAGMEEEWIVAFLRAALTDVCAANEQTA
jgi:hypothetical protein